MDKKSIIGYILIGLVLIGYFTLNKPSAKDIEAQKHYQDSIALIEKIQEFEQQQAEQAKLAEIERLKKDSTDLFFNVLNGKEEAVVLSNDKVNVNLSTYGSRVTSVSLKDYKNQEGGDIVLFDSNDKLKDSDNVEGDNNLEFIFESKQGYKNINTAQLYSTLIAHTDSTATMRLAFGTDRYIDFKYLLRNGSYMLDLFIDAHNMDDILSSKKEIEIDWNQLIRQQEIGYDFEQRYTSLTYKPVDDSSEHLNEMKNDSEKLAEPISWIAYKNQFFSCIMISGEEFNNVQLDSKVIAKGENMLKDCSATMTAPFDPTGKQATAIQFYYGPNKFSTLRESSSMAINPDSDLDLQEIIYFGWPIVRWVNRFFVVYLFDWLNSWGINMGIVLLLLTLIVKAIVFPFTYKQYISTAKMRALKPYIDKINAKYPNPDQALQKQQETMQLYSKYGVSPMSGCLPTLIQMPVWMALFFFIPNAIELRGQKFLWANDLSAYDDLLHWNFNLPLLGDHISLFCLLFSIVNIINTLYTMKQQPAGGDPQQQKMMKWMMLMMPVIFIFALNNYSAGLNYYYFVSTLTTIIIMLVLRKTIDEKQLLVQLEANYAKNQQQPKKKSGMMARLEAMQQQLEEQQKLQQQQQQRYQK